MSGVDETGLTLCRTTVNMHGAKLGAHVLVNLDDPEIARLVRADYLVPVGPIATPESEPDPNAGVSDPDLEGGGGYVFPLYPETLNATAEAVQEPIEDAPVGSQEPPGGDDSPSAGESPTDDEPLA